MSYCVKGFAILVSTRHKIQVKMSHLHAKTWRLGKNKRKKLLRNSFCSDNGDIPVAYASVTENPCFHPDHTGEYSRDMLSFDIDSVSNGIVSVVNTRGNAYALRSAKKYRKTNFLRNKYKDIV